MVPKSQVASLSDEWDPSGQTDATINWDKQQHANSTVENGLNNRIWDTFMETVNENVIC